MPTVTAYLARNGVGIVASARAGPADRVAPKSQLDRWSFVPPVDSVPGDESPREFGLAQSAASHACRRSLAAAKQSTAACLTHNGSWFDGHSAGVGSRERSPADAGHRWSARAGE